MATTVWGTLVFFGVLATSGAALLRAEGPQEEEPQKIEVAAKRFKFTPSKITVDQGTRLEIELYSRDVMHGFRIVGTEIETKIPPRGQGRVKVIFHATEKGKYSFRCSHKCGAGHSSMRGVIVVESAEQERGELKP